ncbi:MAG: hypothetical protein OJF49_002192 [Ktedonobacterales bacterium]|jgi:hypothetical protein|nr:MAG: hypothetical protein OJF49_002192 [Ktedonobacterales bacterium]
MARRNWSDDATTRQPVNGTEPSASPPTIAGALDAVSRQLEALDGDTIKDTGAASRAESRDTGATTLRPRPGAPSLSLPTLTGAQLPALTTTNANRQLALHEDDDDQPKALLIFASQKPRHPSLAAIPRRRGPRSFMAQFITAMITMMALTSALALTTPLGSSAAFAGAFQSGITSLAWVPTRTPTPKPTPTYAPPHMSDPGKQAVVNEIVAVFGSYSQGALNIARCESGYDPNARNSYPIGNSHAEGVFQILYPSTWNTTSYASYSPYDYVANIHAAYQIFKRDGYSWREWECKPY